MNRWILAELEKTTEGIENELKRLEEKIGEVKRRLPAHSVKPPIMMELLELEDRRDVLLKILEKLNRVLKNRASRRDPVLCGFCKCSHIAAYAALSKTPHALADGLMLVFQHPVKPTDR